MRLTAYHGTSMESAQKIKSGGFDDSKVSSENWFGKGHYFFESLSPMTDGSAEAKGWAIKVRRFEFIGVIKSDIESSNALDLLYNGSHKAKYDEIRNSMLQKHRRLYSEESFSEFAVFETLLTGGFDFIRVPSDGGRASKRYKSHFVERFQVQIVVKNKDCIKSRELIFQGRG